MAVKLKRGRLWFIACKTPIPYPPNKLYLDPASGQVNVTLPPPKPGLQFTIKHNQIPVGVGGGPTLRPIRQPLYDSKTLDPKVPPRGLFQNDAIGEFGYFWGTDDNEEVIWRSNWENALGYDTRDEAEVRAFDVAVRFPHLIGKLIVMKLKVRFGA